jgi:hypothetical protein
MSIITRNRIINVSFITSSPTSVVYNDYDGTQFAAYGYKMYDASWQETSIPSQCVHSSLEIEIPENSVLSKHIVLETTASSPTGYMNLIFWPGTAKQYTFITNYDLRFLYRLMEFDLVNPLYITKSLEKPEQLKFFIKNHSVGTLDAYQITIAIEESAIV